MQDFTPYPPRVGNVQFERQTTNCIMHVRDLHHNVLASFPAAVREPTLYAIPSSSEGSSRRRLDRTRESGGNRA